MIKTHKPKKLRSAYKIIGIPLPLDILEGLKIHSLKREISKSFLIREILEEWWRKNKTEKDLKDIASLIQREWMVEKTINYNYNKEDFWEETKKSLLKKGLSQDTIKRILKWMDLEER